MFFPVITEELLIWLIKVDYTKGTRLSRLEDTRRRNWFNIDHLYRDFSHMEALGALVLIAVRKIVLLFQVPYLSV